MDKNTVIVISIMAVLFLFAAAQAVQLTSLKTQLAENELSVGSGSAGIATTGASSSSTGSGSTTASSLNDLPGMVGGC